MAEVNYSDDKDTACVPTASHGVLMPTGHRHHRCVVPRVDNTAENIVEGDMWECYQCKKVYVYLPIPWEREWVEVRWFMFIQRARLRHFKKSVGFR